MNETVINMPGMEIKVRQLEYSWRDRSVVNRIQRAITHLYVFVNSENILQNLENRHQRPYTTWKHELLPNVARAIEQQMGLKMLSKRSWRQKLGCACGCSPGFDVRMMDREGRVAAYDIFVTLQ